MKYSDMILQIRARLNVTQQQLADILKVNFATINRWENGKSNPSKKNICIIENICKENEIQIRGNN